MSQQPELTVAHITTIAMSQRYLLFNQLQSIVGGGYKVAAISSSGEDVAYLEAHGIKHFAVPMTRRVTPIADLVSLWRLYRLMRHQGFTIVHTHNPKPGLLGQLAARLAGVPIVINTIHGFYFSGLSHSTHQTFYSFVEKIAARFSDTIWSQNREDIETALKAGIATPQKIKYLGNGIDLKRFDPEKIDVGILSAKRLDLGIPKECKTVGFVGRLVTEKGVHELMQAARLVVAKNSNLRLLIVGPTDSDKKDAITPNIVEAYGIADHCIFTGLRHDMPELYALMDVFVLPSHREGLPRAPMEASAMQVPCVVTDIRGCREVVWHDENGLVVPLGNVEALSNAIMNLLENPGRAQRLGKRGREIALERFDEQVVFRMVKAEYARLLKQKGMVPPLERGEVAAEAVIGHV